MKNPSYPIRTPRAAGLCLAALLLAPAIAPAQIGAGALTGTNTYEGREEGEVIAINLTTGSFGETLPFDVTFKVAGDALRMIRGYFLRDYFMEKIEHMVDNATYTSIYPRISLAPGQRFVVKGCYIARVPLTGRPGSLEPVTDWVVQ